MTNNIHKDNNSGDISGRITSNNPDGTNSIVTDEEIISSTNAAIDKSALPSNQEYSNIKFLGSSFSGSDIRCLVHLYDDEAQVDSYLSKLKGEKRLANKLKEAANSLASGGLITAASKMTPSTSYIQKRKLILDSAGIVQENTDEDVEAAQYIIGITINTNFFDIQQIGTTIQSLQSLATSQEGIAASLESQISNAKELESQSSQLVELATLQTISVQSHREKYAVRALGYSYAKSYVRGQRTIAGSMIFTVFNEHALARLIRRMANSKSYGERDPDISSLIPDQLPPLDMTISMSNEYGQRSIFRLFGVEFLNDGVTYSIEDLLSENVLTWVARNVDILQDGGNIFLQRAHSSINNGENGDPSKDITATNLINTDRQYAEYLDRFRLRSRLKSR